MNSSDIEKFPYTPSRAIANEVPMEHCLVAGALPAPNGAMDRDDSSMQRASWLEASRLGLGFRLALEASAGVSAPERRSSM